MSDRIIWFKGRCTLAKDAKVSVLSPTSQFGLNVFEGIRAYWNDTDQELYVFRLEDHLKRLEQSCHLIGLNMPYSRQEIKTGIRDVVYANSYQTDIALRITVFVDDEGSWNTVRPADMFIAPIAIKRKSTDSWKGVSATVSSWRRIDDISMPPRIKCGANYINGRYAHLDAQRKGFDLPLFLGAHNKLCEGAGACLFVIRDGVLLTPPSTSSVLESITRDTLSILAQEQGLRVEIRDIDRTELLIADEAFLCGSAAEVTPITSVDYIQLGDGTPGTITTQVAQAYFETVSAKQHGRPDWTWPVTDFEGH